MGVRPTIILGVDPGLANLGIAVLDVSKQRPRVLFAKKYKTSPDDKIGKRVDSFWEPLNLAIVTYGVQLVSMETQEKTAAVKSMQGKSSSKSMGVREVVGLVRGLKNAHFLPMVEPSPKRVKLAVGARGKGKAAVKRGVMACVDGLPKVFCEHVADAVAAAIAGRGYA